MVEAQAGPTLQDTSQSVTEKPEPPKPEQDIEASESMKKDKQASQKPQKLKPVPTLYVRNLNDKIKMQEMRINIYLLFSTFGEISQVRMRETMQLRGQAFVVFKEQMSADRAKLELQGFMMFGKQI